METPGEDNGIWSRKRHLRSSQTLALLLPRSWEVDVGPGESGERYSGARVGPGIQEGADAPQTRCLSFPPSSEVSVILRICSEASAS